MNTNHRDAACRISATDASRQGPEWPTRTVPLPATNPRQPVTASDGDGGSRFPTHPPSQAAAAILFDHRRELTLPVDVAGGAVRRPPPVPPAPISNPDASSSHLGVGYGGQESILPDDLSAGPIPEGELAPAWRALKRGIAQRFRRRRMETFDPLVLSNARWLAFGTFAWTTLVGSAGLMLIAGGYSGSIATALMWSTSVTGALFILNLPRLGWQEYLLAQIHNRGDAEGIRAVRAALGDGEDVPAMAVAA